MGTTPELMEDIVHEGDIVLVTNRFETQLFAVETGVIWKCADIVYGKQFGKFFDFLAAQTVYDARFAVLLLDEFYDVAVDVFCFRPHFIIKVFAVE